MPSDESKGNQLDAIGSLAQRQLDNTCQKVPLVHERVHAPTPYRNLIVVGNRPRRQGQMT